jgi:hypothetical protein
VSKLHLHHPKMSNAASSEGVLSRAQGFVSENKKIIIAGVAAMAVVGVAAAAYYSTSKAGAPRAPRDDLEHGKPPSGKRKSKKPKKGPSAAGAGATGSQLDDANGPILEERASIDTQDSVSHHAHFHVSAAHFTTRSIRPVDGK